ncbi:MAG: DnaA regulatory inactivator Hda [Gammaproteobacteria bacterium]|nr:DnaA regulatory inactivator Hda [Gammaproteobacteria bacterium]MCD8542158.1 DnaA regulatory inactivator Hda [Gammaproteobacteria bacterium]
MQLVFNLRLRFKANLNNFILGPNRGVVHGLQVVARGASDNYAFVWAEEGDGLTHLLQAICDDATQHGIENVYLPLKDVLHVDPSILAELDQISLVCFDDIELIAGQPEWEEALFDLFNRLQENGCRLIVGAHRAISLCHFQLKDLVSRLNSGLAYFLAPLSDQDKLICLQQNAVHRGFVLPKNVAQYFLTHYPRDMRTQLKLLEQLDTLSLQQHHKITLPFVKTHLQLP